MKLYISIKKYITEMKNDIVTYINIKTGRKVEYKIKVTGSTITLQKFSRIKSNATRELILFFSNLCIDEYNNNQPNQPITNVCYEYVGKDYSINNDANIKICRNLSYNYLAWYLNIPLITLKTSIKELIDIGYIQIFGHKTRRFIALSDMLESYFEFDNNNRIYKIEPLERIEENVQPNYEIIKRTYEFFKDDHTHYCIEWFYRMYGGEFN